MCYYGLYSLLKFLVNISDEDQTETRIRTSYIMYGVLKQIKINN